MGIKKLLSLIDVVKESNLEEFRGKTLGIDGYSWIHKAIYNNGHDLIVQKDKTSYLRKASLNFMMLHRFDVKIVAVFDGDKLSSKAGTEEKRETNRDQKKKIATDLLKQGRHQEANKKFSECYDVTPQLAYETLVHVQREVASDIQCRLN